MLNRVLETADHMYRQRFLMDKYDLRFPDRAEPDEREITVESLSEDLEGVFEASIPDLETGEPDVAEDMPPAETDL